MAGEPEHLPPAVRPRLHDTVLDLWHMRVRQHVQDWYAGVPLLKFPEDLRVYEHLLWESRANVVIELGARYGGSALWFRDRLRTQQAYGRSGEPLVIAIDIDVELARRNAASADPELDRIELLSGDLVDPELPERVAALIPDGATCMVVEDSAHTYETTKAALDGFARFVGPGGFFVVEDGCVDVEPLRADPAWPRGVLPALRDWLATPAGAEFTAREDLELYGISCHPGGFLQRRPVGERRAPHPEAGAAAPPRNGHAAAVAAIEAGRIEQGHDELLHLLRERTDAELLNDLAVAGQLLGRRDEAEALLETARLLDPERPDVAENLAALEPLRGERYRRWRRDPRIHGDDPDVPERAYPGMADHATMAQHCMRYAFALEFVGGLDVLDLGCGTGYGSEMLTWAAARVRGFDLWEPPEGARPAWPGGAELTYGHDLCRDPLPPADAATMFEVIEHLPDAPAALRLAWQSVQRIVASFPNPEYHGSHLNPHHVNDWTLERFEQELAQAAAERYGTVQLVHVHQPHGSPLLAPGRDPEAAFWVVVAFAS